ncbi:hypothetical protein SeMB42_g06992 [Synchytrium endobioticum]|uniref:Velvet domain-containing protein n=1 Tax=Synchytrium endobioticum TaxID=286115 RepID=A0A507CGW1_9FUNG|nr:hypothetical protein SeMB42_g06992 [Synchytrium endobioticum]TPX38838.1 hypothetical protein SeLEV6574_g07582 [Synchytrium endobioticum]
MTKTSSKQSDMSDMEPCDGSGGSTQEEAVVTPPPATEAVAQQEHPSTESMLTKTLRIIQEPIYTYASNDLSSPQRLHSSLVVNLEIVDSNGDDNLSRIGLPGIFLGCLGLWDKEGKIRLDVCDELPGFNKGSQSSGDSYGAGGEMSTSPTTNGSIRSTSSYTRCTLVREGSECSVKSRGESGQSRYGAGQLSVPTAASIMQSNPWRGQPPPLIPASQSSTERRRFSSGSATSLPPSIIMPQRPDESSQLRRRNSLPSNVATFPNSPSTYYDAAGESLSLQWPPPVSAPACVAALLATSLKLDIPITLSPPQSQQTTPPPASDKVPLSTSSFGSSSSQVYRHQKATQHQVQQELVILQQLHEETQQLLSHQQETQTKEEEKRRVSSGASVSGSRESEADKWLISDCVRSLSYIDSEYADESVPEGLYFVFPELCISRPGEYLLEMQLWELGSEDTPTDSGTMITSAAASSTDSRPTNSPPSSPTVTIASDTSSTSSSVNPPSVALSDIDASLIRMGLIPAATPGDEK